MEIINFTPFSALAGGIFIGFAASILLIFSGRIAGISGILTGLVSPKKGDFSWRACFILSLLASTLVYQKITGIGPETITYVSTWPILLLGGIFVGIGTRVGGGCTSGHGICGIGRLNFRSIIATVVFVMTGAIAVYVMRHIFGQ